MLLPQMYTSNVAGQYGNPRSIFFSNRYRVGLPEIRQSLIKQTLLAEDQRKPIITIDQCPVMQWIFTHGKRLGIVFFCLFVILGFVLDQGDLEVTERLAYRFVLFFEQHGTLHKIDNRIVHATIPEHGAGPAIYTW